MGLYSSCSKKMESFVGMAKRVLPHLHFSVKAGSRLVRVSWFLFLRLLLLNHHREVTSPEVVEQEYHRLVVFLGLTVDDDVVVLVPLDRRVDRQVLLPLKASPRHHDRLNPHWVVPWLDVREVRVLPALRAPAFGYQDDGRRNLLLLVESLADLEQDLLFHIGLVEVNGDDDNGDLLLEIHVPSHHHQLGIQGFPWLIL